MLQPGGDSLCVLTAQTGSRAYYILPTRPRQVTRVRHDPQHYSGHEQHCPISSDEMTQPTPQVGLPIHGATFTTGIRTSTITRSMTTKANTDHRGLPRSTAAPRLDMTYSSMNKSKNRNNHHDQQGQIACLIFDSTRSDQTDHYDTSHPASEDVDLHRPPRCEDLSAEKIRQLC